MRLLLAVVLLALCHAPAPADILYQQPPAAAGGSFMSAWWDPDGSNYDRYVWDSFTLATGASIAAVEWRGTFGASGAPGDFTVAIYASIAAGTQPDFSRPPLVEYQVGGDAAQTYVGLFGGAPMYDHHFTLPAPFTAQAGVRYWLQIEGWQSGMPDWSIAAGTGGNGSYFLCEHNNVAAGAGVPTGCWFTSRTGDAAFTLLDANATDVGGGEHALLALRGVWPNPSRGERLQVVFSLPDAAPAWLALHDVSGRLLRRVQVGALGAGTHERDLAAGASIRAGIYYVRLSRGDREVSTRAVIVR